MGFSILCLIIYLIIVLLCDISLAVLHRQIKKFIKANDKEWNGMNPGLWLVSLIPLFNIIYWYVLWVYSDYIFESVCEILEDFS